MQIIAPMLFQDIKSYFLKTHFFIIVLLFIACTHKSVPSPAMAVVVKTKIQFVDFSNGAIQTKEDSMCIYKCDPEVCVYEKYEELTETKEVIKKGIGENPDTSTLEFIPTGEVKKYYYAYYKGEKTGYVFEELDELGKYQLAKVDSINKVSPGTNGFPFDSVILQMGAKFYSETIRNNMKTKEVKYLFPDGNEDGDTAILYFKKPRVEPFSITPKLDSLYKMNLYNLTIIMNEKYSNRYKIQLPKREFVIALNERNETQTNAKVLTFIKEFKTKFRKG